MNYIEHRPWGSFENLLDEPYCKVKRIIVKPGQRLSYQFHHKRTEHWVIVQGDAIVTLNDEEHIFTEGMAGKTVTIGCWINKTVTVPNL